MWGTVIAVGIGGALGALCRYWTLMGFERWSGHCPWGTLGVNVAGCFVMGALAEVMTLIWSPAPEIRAFLMTGFLGGFTTFSSYALDIGLLVARGAWLPALTYAVLSAGLTVVAFMAALRLIRIILA